MEPNKLMTPLFYGGMFNREGRKMRAAFVREVSDGTQTYRLWRSAGRQDLEYPRAENDKYILHVEINGYLATLRMTDYVLIDHCGFAPAAQKLYGGEENRGAWIDSLRKSGGETPVSTALAEEQEEIERFGRDPARQVEYIKSLLDGHVSTYLASRENGGQTFPDFTGALVLDDLAKCVELSAIYREKNQAEEEAVSAAIKIIQEGGVLDNSTVRFYQSRYSSSSYSIVNYLMRLYHVDVPLRTQGWINEKLVNITIKDGKCGHLQYLRSKGTRCSQKFFTCMDDLIQAAMARTADRQSEAT